MEFFVIINFLMSDHDSYPDLDSDDSQNDKQKGK